MLNSLKRYNFRNTRKCLIILKFSTDNLLMVAFILELLNISLVCGQLQFVLWGRIRHSTVMVMGILDLRVPLFNCVGETLTGLYRDYLFLIKCSSLGYIFVTGPTFQHSSLYPFFHILFPLDRGLSKDHLHKGFPFVIGN